ncbi:MAG: hypothetical protein HON90_16395 [Halobacteriovoraceae bacterium]|jgi:hypothetical protein|nr:hypothetical protein [Halobacteriovoraceae bacterium]
MRKVVWLVFSFLLSMQVLAVETVISYEDFVNFPYQKKVQTIKLVHDFLTEFEFQNQVFINKNQRKYHTYLKILNAFISSANAADESNSLFDNIQSDVKCYYAGWVSLIRKGKNGAPYCTHPKNLTYPENKHYLAKLEGINPYNEAEFQKTNLYKFYIDGVSKKYSDYFAGQDKNSTPTYNITADDKGLKLAKGSNNCSHRESIPCNPEIYGKFKNSSLCVVTEQNRGINASYLCAKAVEKIEKKFPDDYKVMMSNIIKEGSKPGNQFFDTLKVMYDTCLCGGDSGKKNPVYFQNTINAKYAHKIFESRTCAGILSQTKSINDFHQNGCNKSTLTQGKNNKDWLLFLNAANTHFSKNIQSMRAKKLIKLDQISASQNDINEIFATDAEHFKELAHKNFLAAKEQNLCPVLNTQPRLHALFNEKTNIVTVTALPSDISIFEFKAVNLSPVTTEDKKAASFNKVENKAKKEKSIKFEITRVKDKSQLKAIGTYNGKDIESPPVEIPGIKQVPIGIVLSLEDKVVTMKIAGIKPRDLNQYEITSPTIVKKVEGITPKIEPVAKKGKPALIQKFNISIESKKYELMASLNKKGSKDSKDKKDSNILPIPAQVKKGEKSAKKKASTKAVNCSVKIKREKGQNNYEVSAEPHFIDEKGKKIEAPQGVSLKLTWLDHRFSPKEKIEEQPETQAKTEDKVLSKRPKEKVAEEEKPKKEEEKEENKNKYEELENTFASTGSEQPPEYQQSMKSYNITVIARSKDNAFQCSDKITVPRLPGPVLNGTPTTFPSIPMGPTPSGYVMQGQN